ncbi:MAG TPA: hypothetical protein VIM37_00860 [Candidatus Microsaccharimonas sp.]|jgi:TPR repeat protein
MNELLDSLKAFVTQEASNPAFIHHKWFVQWHLEIVEALTRDMMQFYPEADEATLIALGWMHDYGKIIDYDNQYDHRYIEDGRLAMIALGFEEAFATKIAESIKVFDKKDHLENESIEVRIVSSADACSHLVGPFISLYWHENPQKLFEEIMIENTRKFGIDWDLKVTIPEARQAYQQLHDDAMLHASGEILRITAP